MAKRLTAEEKEALKAYVNAEAGFNNYMGSVFVNDLNTLDRAQWVEKKYAECVRLGLDVGAPSCRRELSSMGV